MTPGGKGTEGIYCSSLVGADVRTFLLSFEMDAQLFCDAARNSCVAAGRGKGGAGRRYGQSESEGNPRNPDAESAHTRNSVQRTFSLSASMR